MFWGKFKTLHIFRLLKRFPFIFDFIFINILENLKTVKKKEVVVSPLYDADWYLSSNQPQFTVFCIFYILSILLIFKHKM
jgi:hypothetical protein